MAAVRVLVYENQRGWRYYWREHDVLAHLLRGQANQDMQAACVALILHGAAPIGSISCRWTPDLFNDSGAQLVASYDPAHGGMRYQP